MTEELITPENLSKEYLKSILDAACMDTSYDSDGDLMVKEDIKCFVKPTKDMSWIRMFTIFGVKEESSRLARLECVNKINDEYLIVRASVTDNDSLFFDYQIPVAGGITKKAFVIALKRFCSIPRDAVSEHGVNVVE